MCGIVGFTGKEQAAPVLLDGLAKLEYRGYDSAGIAVKQDDSDRVEIVKVKGRLNQLAKKTDSGRSVPGCCGIGHTRWATHGEPSMQNAHPHCSDDQNVIVVHNGIIENYLELKEKLGKSGYTFYSQTDTEVITKLLDYYYRKYQGNTLEAIVKVMLRVRGSYALGIMLKEEPGVIYSVRKDSPLIVGRNKMGSLIASDVPAILKYTRSVYYIDNLEIARLTQDGVTFYNIDKEQVEKEPVEIKWDAEAAEKGGFEHFMMKEIHEQPKAVRDTIGSYVKDGRIDLSAVGLSDEEIKEISRLYIVACGSAYGNCGKIRAGRSGEDSGGGGSGFGVPLPGSSAGSGFSGGYHQPVRRDGGQSGGFAGGKKQRDPHAGGGQRGGVQHPQRGG